MNGSTTLRMRWRNCARGDTSCPRLSPSHPATRNGRKTSLGSTARLPASKGRRKNFQGNSLGKSGLDTASLGRVFMDPWGINQWRWIFADDFRLDRSSTFAPKRGGDKSGVEAGAAMNSMTDRQEEFYSGSHNQIRLFWAP